jgi:hypothetical protein
MYRVVIHGGIWANAKAFQILARVLLQSMPSPESNVSAFRGAQLTNRAGRTVVEKYWESPLWKPDISKLSSPACNMDARLALCLIKSTSNSKPFKFGHASPSKYFSESMGPGGGLNEKAN